jgi:hypothetical protein
MRALCVFDTVALGLVVDAYSAWPSGFRVRLCCEIMSHFVKGEANMEQIGSRGGVASSEDAEEMHC